MTQRVGGVVALANGAAQPTRISRAEARPTQGWVHVSDLWIRGSGTNNVTVPANRDTGAAGGAGVRVGPGAAGAVLVHENTFRNDATEQLARGQFSDGFNIRHYDSAVVRTLMLDAARECRTIPTSPTRGIFAGATPNTGVSVNAIEIHGAPGAVGHNFGFSMNVRRTFENNFRTVNTSQICRFHLSDGFNNRHHDNASHTANWAGTFTISQCPSLPSHCVQ